MDNQMVLLSSSKVLYYQGFQRRVFKSLPIFEGKDMSGRVVYLPEIAKDNFRRHVGKLLVELYGNSSIFFSTEHGGQLAGLLRGMLMEINIESKPDVRSIVFECMTIMERIIKTTKEGEDCGAQSV